MKMKEIKLAFVQQLKNSLKSDHPFIQVVIGPRQVGKTTGIKQLLKSYKKKESLYISADGDIARPDSWLFEQWLLAKAQSKSCLLVVDEIQKVENWSEMIKRLWDDQKDEKTQLQLVLLGSSSLHLQKGLSESLAGRYELHKVYHWNPQESFKAYQVSLDDYLIYGGYPGSYFFLKQKSKWLSYVKESIVNAVIAKDILAHSKVKSPALFKQCFELICCYPAQEISYTKLLGQLQDKGNVDLVKYYLDLFEQAFLIKQIFKYSPKKVLTKSSSPKILPLCPALYSIQKDADLKAQDLGRCFEVMIGALLNRLPGQLHYWRERQYEVDYIYSYGQKTYALEVKYGKNQQAKGLLKFNEQHPKIETYIVTPDNYQKVLKELN